MCGLVAFAILGIVFFNLASSLSDDAAWLSQACYSPSLASFCVHHFRLVPSAPPFPAGHAEGPRAPPARRAEQTDGSIQPFQGRVLTGIRMGLREQRCFISLNRDMIL